MDKNKVKEVIKDVSEISIQTASSIIGGMVSEVLISQVLPGATTIIFTAKQKKTERMFKEAIKQINERIDEIDEKLEKLSQRELNFVEDNVVLVMLCQIEKELEEEKIKYFVNGMISAIEKPLTEEDIIIGFHDILSQLRMLDIRILVDAYKRTESSKAKEEKRGCDIENEYEALELYATRKLESLGLVTIHKTFNDLQGKEMVMTKDRLFISTLGKRIIEFFGISVE